MSGKIDWHKHNKKRNVRETHEYFAETMKEIDRKSKSKLRFSRYSFISHNSSPVPPTPPARILAIKFLEWKKERK